MKTKFKLLVFLFISVFLFSTIQVEAQSLKQLREKAKKEAQKKLNEKKKKKNTTTTRTSGNQNTNTNTSTNNQNNSSTTTKVKVEEVIEVSLLESIKAEQAKIVAENKIVTQNGSKGAFPDVNISAYLSFTNDFKNKDANILHFKAGDHIYAKLNMEKVLTEILPDENASGLQYYRLEVKINGRTRSELKLNKKKHFKFPYSKKDVLIAVVPEKEFYESIKTDYANDSKPKQEAYYDILARNFGSMNPKILQGLSIGEHKIEIEFEITAKLSSDKYFAIKNMKGVFMITIDEDYRKQLTEDATIISSLQPLYEKESNQLYAEEHHEELLEDRRKVMESYANDPNKGTDNNNFKINIKNTNSGQSIRVIERSSRGNENIHTIQPNATLTLSLFKGQTYTILSYGQSAAKSTARKVATVTKSNDGATINVK